MLFNSIEFIMFFPLVFAAIWVFKSYKIQNIVIVISSYIFYGWWDWRFLSLIFFSTVVDYLVGGKMSRTESSKSRKRLLILSLISNLGLLGFFKYYNFFVENFVAAFTLFGQQMEASTLSIVLPVGISFYTFQTLSYTIDVYRRKIEPTKDFLAFTAFVSFFPQLVAGPIERASNLLPQFTRRRQFDYYQAVDGMRQILWGLFKKVVIADNCAVYVDSVFSSSAEQSGLTLLIGAIFFTVQIYCDFSGYSDMAIGLSKLLGFNLMQNFAFPFFSRDIAEFWRRWHISLSTWFRDYLYIPLGGSRGNRWINVRNVMIVFVVSGFWHGANWTFVIWGFLNALYFLPLLLLSRNRTHLDTVAGGRFFPNGRDFIKISATFLLTVLAFVFFRSESVSHAGLFMSGIFSNGFESLYNLKDVAVTGGLICFLFFIEWLGRDAKHALEGITTFKRPLRWACYIFILLLTSTFMQTNETPFIYFQF